VVSGVGRAVSVGGARSLCFCPRTSGGMRSVIVGVPETSIAYQLTRGLRCTYATQPGPGMLSNGQTDSASVLTSGASVTPR